MRSFKDQLTTKWTIYKAGGKILLSFLKTEKKSVGDFDLELNHSQAGSVTKPGWDLLKSKPKASHSFNKDTENKFMIDYDRMSTSYSLVFIEVSGTLLPLRNMRVTLITAKANQLHSCTWWMHTASEHHCWAATVEGYRNNWWSLCENTPIYSPSASFNLYTFKNKHDLC